MVSLDDGFFKVRTLVLDAALRRSLQASFLVMPCSTDKDREAFRIA